MRFARTSYRVTAGSASKPPAVIPLLAPAYAMTELLQSIGVAAAVMAVLQVPARAQENAAPPSAAAPAPGPAVPAPAAPGPAVPGPAVPGPTQPSPSAEPPPNQEASRNSDHGRFVFHPIANGFLRLDMATGAVASCTPDGIAWNCVAGRDERTALDREIARLQRDNAVLKNALLEHGVALPGGMVPNPPADAAGGGPEPIPRPPQTVPPTPTGAGASAPGAEGAIDHVMDAVEKGWRRVVETVTNLWHDLEQ
jgi:hypothetical protein